MNKLLILSLLLSLFSFPLLAQEDDDIDVPTDSTVKRELFFGTEKLSYTKGPVKTRFLMLELGINSYHSGSDINIPASLQTFELRHGRSLEVNLHIYRQRIKIGKGVVNIEHGLSFDFNHYAFQNKVMFSEDAPREFFINTGSNIERSRLRSSRMTLPLMLHFETNPKRLGRSFHIGAGAYASVRLGSDLRTKDFNARRPNVYRTGFGLNDFLFGGRFEMGYGPINIYATYSFTSLFKTGQGPELTPFSVGFVIIPW